MLHQHARRFADKGSRIAGHGKLLVHEMPKPYTHQRCFLKYIPCLSDEYHTSTDRSPLGHAAGGAIHGTERLPGGIDTDTHHQQQHRQFPPAEARPARPDNPDHPADQE